MRRSSPTSREFLEANIVDCEQMEEEFTKKAVTFSNFFTDTGMKGEAAKRIISRLDNLNHIKLVYDPDKKQTTLEELQKSGKKPGRIKRVVITAITTAALMGAAYFGGKSHFTKQDYKAQIHGLRAEASFVLLQKQDVERNNLEQQKVIDRQQEDYVQLQGKHVQNLEQIADIKEEHTKSLDEKAELQRNYNQTLKEKEELQKARANLHEEYADIQDLLKQSKEQLKEREQEYSGLEQAASELKQQYTQLHERNSALSDRIAELQEMQSDIEAKLSRFRDYDLEIEHFIENQIIQRTKKYGSCKGKGPFANFVDNYAQFFFGKTPSAQQKQLINTILRKYVKTDGKDIDKVIQSWNCNTILLQYNNNRLQVIDP